ncbi:Transposase [Candidatus Pantoea symbiotica]|jgi:transposase|uniref:Transposase n=1 Tax=Candidatus Pantoea symbiotica TaxID=1884370 RepID=A0A1I4EVJ9_9GAMM|nr:MULTISPECIES: ISNCY family transposase [Pantoea]KAJ9430267.1 ISNCY family transposase [Pantoea sp. YR343]MRT27178.1 ISNCY family transposase [Enterobacteriaceae bacterium RIT697]SFL09223.1 Transposase [Pantoea symbiotica]SFV09196.1 Transposase [Pantoea sp. YR525]
MAASGVEFFTMNEVNRLKVIQDVVDRRLTTHLAAERLGISDRQCRRLLQRYRIEGPLGMADRRRGKPSNYQLPEGLAERAIQIIRERYPDFGPTLACEKLAELHGVMLSKETVRKLMMLAGFWIPRRHRASRIQQPRYRRACVGELIQIDGCDHRWFEERGPACTLLVYVDDATSRLMQLHFVRSESTFTYFQATRGYLELYGKPLAFYSDKASVFRINNKNAAGGDGQTQFGRALNELNITGICANTSSAKGRVERAHLTLQDRLVKELRLRGISTPDAANAFAAEFMADYNRRFAKAPRHDFDVHRPLDADDNLNQIFTWREPRKVSKALTVRYDKMLLLLEDNDDSRRAMGKYLDAWQYPDGRVELRSHGTVLPYSAYDRLSEVDQGAIVDNKRLGHALAVAKLMQDKRDNTRSQALPAGTGPSRRSAKKDPAKKRQRAVNEDDLLEALNDLQARSQEIFGN